MWNTENIIFAKKTSLRGGIYLITEVEHTQAQNQ